jgi:hypothetical protein
MPVADIHGTAARFAPAPRNRPRASGIVMSRSFEHQRVDDAIKCTDASGTGLGLP